MTRLLGGDTEIVTSKTEQLPETHRRQIKDGQAKAMSASGIGVLYHNRSVREFGDDGERLADWILRNRPKFNTSPKGLILEGAGAHVMEMFTLTARGVFMCGASVRLTGLIPLVEAMGERKSSELVEDCADVPCLFIRTFQDRRAEVLTGWQAGAMQDFILSRLDRGKATFLHCVEPMTRYAWWGNEFIQTMLGVNDHMVISSRKVAKK